MDKSVNNVNKAKRKAENCEQNEKSKTKRSQPVQKQELKLNQELLLKREVPEAGPSEAGPSKAGPSNVKRKIKEEQDATKKVKTDKNTKREEFLDNSNVRGGGSKKLLHGNKYQLHVLMLFLWRAQQNKYLSFRLGTELEEIEKLEDAIFQYQKHGNDKLTRFVQVKHADNSQDNYITRSSLLSKDDKNNYSLQKYFHSYIKIKAICEQNSMYSIFPGSKIEDLILCTNIGFDPKINLNDFFEKIDLDEDEILKLSNDLKKKYPKAAIYKFKNIENNEIIKKLKPIIEETSDFRKLFDEIASCIANKNQLYNVNLVKYYSYALFESVFEINKSLDENSKQNKLKYYVTFQSKFLESDKNYILKFRNELEKKLNNNKYSNKMESIEIDISDGLAKKCLSDNNPNIQHIREFAKEIKVILGESEDKIIKIPARKNTKFFRNYLQLAGYILIKNADKINFSTRFLEDLDLPGNLNEFRDNVKELIGEDKFASLYEYDIQVVGKKFTCEEAALHRKLPVLYEHYELEEFFNKFKIVVNYPSAEDIDNIIGDEMKLKYKSLNVTVNKTLYMEKLYNWINNRKTSFLTVKKTDKFFDEIDREVKILAMEGRTEAYFSSISEYKFKIYECIKDFLQNKEKQIFDLVFQDFYLGRTRVVQSLQDLKNENISDIQKYIHASGGIFLKLTHLRDHEVDYVVDCFNDTNLFNLLVIEYDSEFKENFTNKLYNIVNESPHKKDKKIIFITQENYNLPKKFKEFRYINKVDESNFSDLNEYSQNALLKKKAVFQGNKLTLRELLNEIEASYIDSHVLSELLNKKEIEIDPHKPANLKEIKNYYIDRNLDIKLEFDITGIKKNDSDLFYICNINKEEAHELFDIRKSDFDSIQFSNFVLHLLMLFDIHKMTKNDSSLEVTSSGTIYYNYKDFNKKQKQLYILKHVTNFEVNNIDYYNSFNQMEEVLYDFYIYYRNEKKKYRNEKLHVVFIIYTNSAFQSEILHSQKIKKMQLKDIDDILNFENYMPNNYRLVSDQLKKLYQSCFEIYELADELVKCIFEKSIFKGFITLTRYFFQLNEEIINFKDQTFYNDFMKNVLLSDKSKKLRTVFLYIIRNTFRGEPWIETDERIWEKIESILSFSENKEIPNVFKQLNYNPQFQDINKFTRKFIELLNVGTNKKEISIKLDRKILGTDIDNLAVHVLVLTDTYDATVKFSSAFLDTDTPLLGNFEVFRNVFNSAINFSGIKDYRFEIENFKTCLAKNHFDIPNELVSEFFKKIVFKVDQPDEEQLNDIVKKKLDGSYDSKLQNIASNLRVDSAHENIFNNHLILKFFLKKINEFNLEKFCLARKVNNINYFNDVVFKYANREAEIKYIFIQTQFLGIKEKINAYNLSKYFDFKSIYNRYDEVMKNYGYEDRVKKAFFIYTDANFDIDNLKLNKIEFEELNTVEDILDIRNDIQSAKYYKIIFNKQNAIYKDLIEKSHLYSQAEYLANCVYKGRVIEKNKLDTLLIMEVIDVANKKLHNNFVNDELVSKLAKIFREYFVIVYRNFNNDTASSDAALRAKLQQIGLKLSTDFQIFRNDLTFPFIRDVILSNQEIIKICTMENDDDDTLKCEVTFLDKIKSYTISLTLFKYFFPKYSSVASLKNSLERERSALHATCIEKLNKVDYISYNDLTNFFKSLLFVQWPSEFENINILQNDSKNKNILQDEIDYDSSDGYILKKYKYLEDPGSFKFDKNKISPGLVRFVNEEDPIKIKPVQIILSTRPYLASVTNFKEIYPNHTIHFLEKQNNEFLWKSSQGSLVNIRDFMTENKKEYKSTEIDDGIVCIAAEPGMGKSTLLKYVTEKIKKDHPDKWVIRINLTNCKNQLEEHDGKFDDIDKIIEFLHSVAGLKNELEKKFLRFQLSKHGNITLLFDGFDEIYVNSRPKIITLLNELKKYEFEKLWITTRLHLKNEIEDELSIFSYNMKPFSEGDQINFIENFWIKEFKLKKIKLVKEELIKTYVVNLVDFFNKAISNKERDFLGIPLQSKMLAVVMNNNFYKEALQNKQINFKNLPTHINLLYLYRKFIDAKFEIYFRDKKKYEKCDGNVEALKDNFTKLHQREAFKFLNINVLEESVITTPEYINELNSIGIVELQNNELNFIHRTFAEYFVAERFSKILKDQKTDENYKEVIAFLEDAFFNNETELIIKFIDCILVEPYPILYAAINNDENYFQSNNFENSMNDIRDAHGRTALHLASKYNSKEVINSLLQKRADVNIFDNFGWTPIVYSVQNTNWHISELLLNAGANFNDIMNIKNAESVDKDGVTVLHFAAKHCIEVVQHLLKQNIDVNVADKKGWTPLFYAIKYNNFEMVQYLISENANVNHADVNNTTPIFYAIDHYNGNMSIIQFLVNVKADINFVRHDSLDPISHSKIQNKSMITQYLREEKIERACPHLHGINYQLRLFMLFLWRAEQKKDFSFLLGTELEEIEKFYDVVFQYQKHGNDKLTTRFVQVKHTSQDKYITRKSLLSKNDNNNYSVQKYFHSHIKNKNRFLEKSKYSILSGSEKEDLILCTNIGFDPKIKLKNFFEKIELDEDEILKLSDDLKKKYPKAAIYKFKNIENNKIIKDLEPIIAETSDFRKLINEIASCILNKKPLNNTKLAKYYFYALTRNVFSIARNNEQARNNEHKFYAKFLPKFLEGDVITQQFKDELQKKLGVNISDASKFYISANLAKIFIPNENPSIGNVLYQMRNFPWKIFAEKIRDRIDNSANKIINICDHSNSVFSSNIRKIAGYVFVNKYYSKKIKFSASFLNDDKLPGNLNEFRDNLKQLIGEEKFSTLYEYDIQIADKKFRTCEEAALHRKLPVLYDDCELEEFFDKFKIVVNYPNAEDINDLICDEIKIKYNASNVSKQKKLLDEKVFEKIRLSPIDRTVFSY